MMILNCHSEVDKTKKPTTMASLMYQRELLLGLLLLPALSAVEGLLSKEGGLRA